MTEMNGVGNKHMLFKHEKRKVNYESNKVKKIKIT